jgi:excinuclease ABC subunit C
MELRDRGKAIDKVLALPLTGSAFLPRPTVTNDMEESAALVTMKHLCGLLNLPHLPFRVEGIDVSHISGKEATGVVTVFENGMPKPEEYRRFRIKFSPTRDDCRMISEVVGRRYRRLVDGEMPRPDLVLIDGGMGQVASARRKLKELGLDDIEVIGIAKKFERVYRPGSKDPLIIPATASILNFLKLVRDEAHRFAQRYHHLLRKKGIFS